MFVAQITKQSNSNFLRRFSNVVSEILMNICQNVVWKVYLQNATGRTS